MNLSRRIGLFLGCALLPTLAWSNGPVKPLFDENTPREPDTTEETEDALVTRFADRVRDRHAREVGQYDHYLSWYWEERTVTIEIVDRVAKGGRGIEVTIYALAELNRPDFRCFFRGINTVAEYHHNVATSEMAPRQYTTTITHNPLERRELRVGDRMEFEFSPFLLEPKHGRKNYYGTATLYVVGRGIVPWHGMGENLDSYPLPKYAWLGGRTTLPLQYSKEPRNRFKQMAMNMAPASAQPFMLGRRLHHTDFGSGKHSEQPNPSFDDHAGKLGPNYVARSCIACHEHNGRALPPRVGAPMYQTVVKVGTKSEGRKSRSIGSAIQPQNVDGDIEATATIGGYETITGMYADGTEYELRRPTYDFSGTFSGSFSVRLTPQLVGLGLLEAIPESTIANFADPDDKNGDGVSGRMHTVLDPETGDWRLGRFGYKAAQPRVRHQVAAALNSDMGVTTSVYSKLDGEHASGSVELSDDDLARLTRYVSTLGVSARRLVSLDEERGEELFVSSGCAACHVPTVKTSAFHPLAELRGQTIHPYSDLLLHDMGAGLADNLDEGDASGAEWRTAPLWNIGLTSGVSGAEAYLHDGRARSLEEAILWHGGEAESSKETFRKLPAEDRNALVRFLKSL